MTAVAFHFGMADRLGYACRLLRKASRAGARVVVTGAGSLLDQLDRQLWVFDATEFLPHWRGRSPGALPPRLAITPIVLVDALAPPAPGFPVLLNLADQAPQADGLDRFERVIEVVDTDESTRALARVRWRHYASLGFPIERQEVGA